MKLSTILSRLDACPVGAFGAAFIEQDLAAADRATAAGDTVGMLRAYQTLKEIEA